MKKIQSIISIALVGALVASTPLLGEADSYKNDNKYEKSEKAREKEEERLEKEAEKAEKAREKEEEKAEKAREKEEEKAEKAKEKEEERLEKEAEKTEKAREKEEEKAEKAKEKEEERLEKEQEKAYKDAKTAYKSEENALKLKEIELKNQLKEAKITQDQEKIKEIKAQIDLLTQQRIEIKKQMKENILTIKKSIKNKYNNAELKNIENVGNELQSKYKDIKALPIDNIYVKGSNIKFDTPAIIKSNRTLVPVRALTEGFGADVVWNQEEKKVTITKGDIVVEIQLDNNTATVNGKEVKLDVPSSSYGNRTYVPLRFIVENLGLNVEHDQESGLIEIDEIED